MSDLFVVMLGGHHARANTEVHDVVFAIGNTLEEIYPQLKQAWFGEQKGLHIDSWMKVNGVETEQKKYRISFSHSMPNEQSLKLFLINLGGYDSQLFGELHRYILVVALNEVEAKRIGKKHFHKAWSKQHTDRILDVDDCLAIDCIAGRYIVLEESDYVPTVWENCYIKIGQ
ncbi:DUF1543 domain-containing protein [Acinetobacter equi]|uniref:DUF1543 domain-containing protein n=1 Tax=Acinetobacter equi TaxID=1324350 RepID=A0A0N9V7S9_9GAMM|nr:DUF1543 domain-containing protein [Acinetobacter equi]ALH95239.1 hypothetical protein AOY20_06625 [Acinetobacter equi]